MNPNDSNNMPNQPGGVINPSQPQSGNVVGPSSPQTMPGQDMFQPSVPAYQPMDTTVPTGQPAMPQQTGASAMPSQAQPGIQPITKLPSSKKPSKKLPLIIAGSVVGLLIIITLGAVLLSGGSKAPEPNNNQTQVPEGPQPASAIDVEQANNSITQDVTGHDNTKDFPDDMLSDSALSL